jgi:hypothetical protein
VQYIQSKCNTEQWKQLNKIKVIQWLKSRDFMNRKLKKYLIPMLQKDNEKEITTQLRPVLFQFQIVKDT